MKKQETFCLAPFRSSYLNNNVARPCCWYKKSTLGPQSTDLNNIHQTFHSEDFKKIRGAMLNNDYLKGCQLCYEHEKKGGKSHRQFWNEREFSHDSPNNRSQEASLKALDLNMGNLCNLKCIMCDSYNSTKWIDDENSMEGKAKCSELKKFNLSKLSLDSFKNLEWLKLAGGEVFLMPEHEDLLSFLIREELAPQIELVYVTNNSISGEKFFEKWKNFKKIRLILSIDGIGPINEYIRFPVKWEQNLKVIEEFRNMSEKINLTLEVNSVVSVLNVCHLSELYRWWTKFSKNEDIFFRVLNHPEIFDIRNMPKSLKTKAIESLAGLPPLEHVIQELQNSSNNPTQWNNFEKWILKLDEIRHTNFQSINPQFFT